MIKSVGLEENFRFVVAEVESQLSAAFRFLTEPERSLYRKIVDRDDYIDNLKTIIENKCFSTIHSEPNLSQKELNTIRSMHTICVNLERIADFCVNVVRQVEHLTDPRFLHRFDYKDIFAEAQKSTAKILPVLHQADLGGSLSICRSEYEMDRMYKAGFDHIMGEIQKGKHITDYITALFILRYLERIGDSLLNIGEALMFAILGEKIKIEQYESLRQTLVEAGYQGTLTDVEFRAIWGTRSGCHIGRLETDSMQDVSRTTSGRLYKEGNLKKIKLEKENLERWASLFPGLVPRLHNYLTEKDKAALLMDFIPGCTLDEILLTGDDDFIEVALFALCETIEHIWSKTLHASPIRTDIMEQLESRLNAILRIHPDFQRLPQKIGTAAIEPTDVLINKCKAIEEQLQAPFSVLIHGDFNINNIVFNASNRSIHYIDLYRSRDFDYIQDASVFLISNFRIPVFDPVIRNRLNDCIRQFFAFFRTFAEKNGDSTFHARMTLGLARSFLTSTRFEFNEVFAKEMYFRAVFLLEKLLAHKGPFKEYLLKEDILYY